jgi:hypothetical protein
MPSPTDLVTDLPADFEVFGQAVATSMADLLGGASGYILSKNSATDMDFTWIPNDQGDITGITATTPLTGGGSSGAVTVGIQDALTTQKGAVQLSDSTSTTSSILAATPTAVKSAYDLADGAIAKTTVTTAGDIIYRNATVPVRLGIGTAGQVLKVNSGATAPEWASASAAAQNFTLISSTALSGSTVTVSSLSGYNQLMIICDNVSTNTTYPAMSMRLNSDTTAKYSGVGTTVSPPDGDVITFYQDFNSATSIYLGEPGSLAADQGGMRLLISGANGTGMKVIQYNTAYNGTTSTRNVSATSSYTGTSVISSVSLITGSGTFDTGTIYVYGAA